MNTTHVEHDALAALRAELTMAAGRRIRRRRIRRRTLVIVALIALLLAATAATAALVKNTTGVPAIDQLVDIEGHPGGRPISSSERLVVPEGDHRTNVVAYLTGRHAVCITTADLHRGGARGTFGGCPPLKDVQRQVDRRGAAWFGGTRGLDARVAWLIVGGDVDAIQPLGEGDWTVKMAPPWRPRARGGRPLRLVAVVDTRHLTGLAVMTPLFPKLELTFSDGSTQQVDGR
jgi:hypothetical protein